METQNLKFERLSNAAMSKLSNQEMSITFGGYIYEETVFVQDGLGNWYWDEFYFNSAYDYEEQYQDFQQILWGYDLVS